MRYEIHFDGKKIPGSLKDLKIFALNIKDPYVIYQFFESKMCEIKIRKSHSGEKKELLSEDDKETAIRLYEKGYDKKLIAKKLYVSFDYMNKNVNFPKPVKK